MSTLTISLPGHTVMGCKDNLDSLFVSVMEVNSPHPQLSVTQVLQAQKAHIYDPKLCANDCLEELSKTQYAAVFSSSRLGINVYLSVRSFILSV